jgi:nucleotide-binding universal stress UspA family protein
VETYRRILAAVDLDAHTELVLQRAWRLARRFEAALLVLHVVDDHAGFESDHGASLTGPQLNASLAKEAERRLHSLLERVGAPGVEVRAVVGEPKQACLELAAAWRPDLAVVGTHATHGLRRRRQELPFDVLIVQLENAPAPARFLRSLLAPLLVFGD